MAEKEGGLQKKKTLKILLIRTIQSMDTEGKHDVTKDIKVRFAHWRIDDG